MQTVGLDKDVKISNEILGFCIGNFLDGESLQASA
jgi:hypothetical protein